MAGLIDKVRASLPATAVGIAWLFALRRLDDFDTWWHLAAGRWIVQHGTVPRTDPLSYASSHRSWINPQWLYEVCIYGLHRAGGANLLVFATALGYAAVIALLVRNLRRTLGPLSAALIALWVTVVAQERFSVRPELVSFLLLQIVLWLLTTARRDDGRRLWLLPAIILLWVNTHQLFSIGLAVIGCYVAGSLAARLPFFPTSWRTASHLTPAATRRLLLSGAGAVLVTAANPYWIKGALYPFQLFLAISGSNPVLRLIGELHSPFDGYFHTFAITAYQSFLVFSAVVVGWACLLTGRSARPLTSTKEAPGAAGGIDLSGLAVFVGLGYLSVLARRNMALFALGGAPFVGECLSILLRRGAERFRGAYGWATRVLTLTLAPTLPVLAWLVVSNSFYRLNGATQEFGTGVMEVHFPMRAAAFAQQLNLPGRLYNDIQSGGYLTWAAPIDGGPYIDGRLGLDVQFFADFVSNFADPARWQAEADRIGVNTVLLSYRWDNRHVLIRWLLNDSRWALVYFDDVAVVFVRRTGNEDLIDTANQLFATYNQELLTRLATPVASWWQWPIGRTQELWNYGTVLDLVGVRDVAAAIYARLLTLRLSLADEIEIELRLALDCAAQGDLPNARQHLRRAAELDPQNPAVAQVRVQIDG